jgi:intracellular sulfur oxidation DsrE/DsrF family protein
MNKNIIITCLTCLVLLVPHLLVAQSNYRVVFDLTSKDSVDQKNILRWLNEISKSDPAAMLEVVLYGQSLDLVIKDRSPAPETISGLIANKNVSFKVCKVAMKNQHVDISQLIPGVGTVPDGIYEIISRQREGWGYIKVAH